MYVAVKGGERAIEASYDLLGHYRRGDHAVSNLSVDQIQQQLGLLVSRVMAEAAVYDPQLAALSIKQACGDTVEAVFLLRAYRTTLPRFGVTLPLDTTTMSPDRRVSAIFKDLPGGQVLGATFDYTQRLLDFDLLDSEAAGPTPETVSSDQQAGEASTLPDPLAILSRQGLIEPVTASSDNPDPGDITTDPPKFPMARPARLQMMARADEGWLLGMGYSTQRGYAYTHPFAGEVRQGQVAVRIHPDELNFPLDIGEIELTECQMVNQFVGSDSAPPMFTRGYGLVLGRNERKAMAMSLVDRVLRADEFDEPTNTPASDQEFSLSHGDSVEASGFVQHLKLPHYVTFESELELVRQLRAERSSPQQAESREENE